MLKIEENVGRKIIGYYSLRNTGLETRYKAYDLKLMAVVKAVKSFAVSYMGTSLRCGLIIGLCSSERN